MWEKLNKEWKINFYMYVRRWEGDHHKDYSCQKPLEWHTKGICLNRKENRRNFLTCFSLCKNVFSWSIPGLRLDEHRIYLWKDFTCRIVFMEIQYRDCCFRKNNKRKIYFMIMSVTDTYANTLIVGDSH